MSRTIAIAAVAIGVVAIGIALQPVERDPMQRLASWMLRQAAAGKSHFVVVSADERCAW